MRTLFLLLSFFIGTAIAVERPVQLKAGDGKDTVVSQCSLCHSLDYITNNTAIMNRAGWEKTVNKMIKVMGATIEDADKKIIIDYLTSQYGR
jgi:cytochrome c5